MSLGPYPWMNNSTNTSNKIAGQTESTYLDHMKIKGFEDVGYFLVYYIVSGGIVTPNATRNDMVDATKIVVSLNDDIMAREGAIFQTSTPSTTYYLDFAKDGDWSWGTAHPEGTVLVDYLTIAEVTTDSAGLIGSITDVRGEVGGFRLKDGMGLDSYMTKGSILFNVKDYGALGDGSNDTTAIQAAINAAIAVGSSNVYFPPGSYEVTALSNIYIVNLFGDNADLKISNVPYKINDLSKINQSQIAYSRALADMAAANYPLNGLDRALEAIHAGTLRVLYWGDSITEGASQLTYHDAYAYRLDDQIKRSLPNVNVVSANYALGGRDSSQSVDPNYKGLASEPPDPASGFYRPWSTVGKSWLDTVKDFKPDLIIYAFGMNDSYYNPNNADKIIANNTASLINIIKAWSPAPSMVVVPTILPTKNIAITSPAKQEMTKAVSRASRTVAQAFNTPYADAGRIFGILRDGYDDDARGSTKESNFLGYDTGGWRGNLNEFTLSGNSLTPINTNPKFVARDRLMYDGIIDVTVTFVNPTDTAWIKYREAYTFGYLVVFTVPGAPGSVGIYDESGTVLATATGLNIPFGAPHKLVIDLQGARTRLYLNGAAIIDTRLYQKLYDGYVSFGSLNSSPIYSDLTMMFSDPLSTETPYNELELLGNLDESQSGNGINHPSALGNALIYSPAFDGLVSRLSSITMSYRMDVSISKTNIAAGATVDLFGLEFAVGSYTSAFVEVTSWGVMQGAGARSLTSRYLIDWNNNSGGFLLVDTKSTGTSGNQLSHVATSGASPKISCATVGTVDGSDLKTDVRLIGTGCKLNKL